MEIATPQCAAINVSQEPRNRIHVAQWITELKCYPELLRDLMAGADNAASTQLFPDIRTETRLTVDTATAAHWLSRRPQTLRGWACHEDGPIRPIRINRRLAWATEKLRRLLGVSA